MTERQLTLIGIENGKGHVKALRGDLPALLVGKGVLARSGTGEARDATLDHVLAHATVQIASRPLDFDVDDAIEDAVDAFDDDRQL